MKPVVIGLTGPSGGGKTTAGRLLVQMGAALIDCDRLAREVQQPGSACLDELCRAFGRHILLKNGGLDRRRLGELCFGNAENMALLNSVTHKYILELLPERINSCRAPLVFVEAGALYESGADALCDDVVAVLADKATAIRRLTARDGLTAERAADRLSSQLPQDTLAARADYVIYNDSDIPSLKRQLTGLLEKLKIKYHLEGLMSEKEKTASELLADEILLERKSAYKIMSETELAAARELAGRYMKFIGAAKTERECVNEALVLLHGKGFEPFDPKKSYRAGDKVYVNNRGKNLIAAVIGARPIEEGVRIVASHTDSPRLDLRPYPLYEDSEIALFKTHYYGGIKKYQWTNIPLALHGVVMTAAGDAVPVCIGEDESDPVLYITNLLPHLSASHNQRTAADVIKGEELNIVVGLEPFDKEAKEGVKLNVMRLLNEKYGITEKDFIRAELEVVPAFRPRYIGIDRSMIGAYGHDDRVCAYQTLEALLGVEGDENTCLCIFADKEETGSDGATGMNSDGLRNFIRQLVRCVDPAADPIETIHRSKCLSTDVTAALDPTFADVMERRNSSYLGYGVSVDKYGGSRGKYGCNDASAEYMGEITRMLDGANVCWQTGELGRIDAGGGGTVAKFISAMGIDTVDAGVPLLSMHSPFELASVVDIYSFYRLCEEFFKL